MTVTGSKTIAALALLCALLQSCTGAGVRKLSVEATAPNIVILFADDLGYGDLGSYGHPNIETPQLDALAAGGQRWTDFYAPAPVCSPSRGALLTGRLPNRTGLYGKRIRVMFPGDPGGIPEREATLAQVLKGAGYQTAIIGKWHLGDTPAAFPTRHGFDYWFGIPYSNDMDWVGSITFTERLAMLARGESFSPAQEQELAQRPAKYLAPSIDYWNVPVWRSRRDAVGAITDELVERPAQQTTVMQRYTEEAEAFIASAAATAQPFLLYLPYTMPHTPLFTSAAFARRDRGGLYGDVVAEIDASVGRVVAALEQSGVRDNTLVVFTSDNGPWLAMRHHGGSAGLLRMGKGTTFEGGMRVPAIFNWPGRIAAAVVHDIGSGMDLYPTALNLAGVAPPAVLDGVDLTPRLLRNAPTARNSISYYREGSLMAYRRGPWKLHTIIQGAYGDGPERTELATPALYNLEDDPAERFDVAAAHPEIVAQLRAAMAAHTASFPAAAPLFDRRLVQ